MTASLQQATSIVILALIVLTNIIAGMGKPMILSPNFTHRRQAETDHDGSGGCPPPPFDSKNFHAAC